MVHIQEVFPLILIFAGKFLVFTMSCMCLHANKIKMVTEQLILIIYYTTVMIK